MLCTVRASFILTQAHIVRTVPFILSITEGVLLTVKAALQRRIDCSVFALRLYTDCLAAVYGRRWCAVRGRGIVKAQAHQPQQPPQESAGAI